MAPAWCLPVGMAGFEPTTSASRNLPAWIGVDWCGLKPQVSALGELRRTAPNDSARAMDARCDDAPTVATPLNLGPHR